MRRLRLLATLALLPIAGCNLADLTGISSPDAPTNLSYQLIPSGDPNVPLGIILTWQAPRNGNAVSYDVYARSSSYGGWQRRATTTSPSFHDAGVPEAEYYVQALDAQDNEMGRSDAITIDERNRLPAPLGITSISLNHAVQLAWSDNAVTAGGAAFDYYRVYSAPYDVTYGQCTQWVLEGTTASDEFLAADLTNGQRRCFAVSAVSTDGHESAWSDVAADTPRWDAHSVLVYAAQVRADSAGFLFHDGITGAYGYVSDTARTGLDVMVQRAADSTLWLVPGRAAVTAQVYGSAPIADLTNIDRAPTSGYGSVSMEAVPSFGYVFRLQGSDGVRYAAMRVALVTRDYVVFDWSYQSGVNDPELNRVGTDAGLVLSR